MHLRLSLFLTSLLLAACGGGGSSGNSTDSDSSREPTPKSLLELNAFASCDAYRDYYADALTREFLTAFYAGIPCWSCGGGVVGPTGAPGFADDASREDNAQPVAGSPSADFSDTNTQEAGVDEADLIETDSANGLFYFLERNRNELLVLDAEPATDLSIVSRTSLDTSGLATGIYLDTPRNRLVVIVSAGHYGFTDARFPARQAGTTLLFYDVSNPAQPLLTNRRWIEAQHVDSRRIDGRLHLITQHHIGYPQALNNDQDFQNLVYNDYLQALRDNDELAISNLGNQIETRVHNAVAAANLGELLPRETVGLSGPDQTLACTSIQHPGVDTQLGLLIITSVNTDGTAGSSVATVNNAWQVYASADNLYLMQTSGGWWFGPQQTQQTAIYRFNIGNAAGIALPAGSGVVDGWINNRFSVGEFDNHLRIATTQAAFGDFGTANSTNHLTVLRLDPGALTPVGAVRDFIRDEQIFSARFVGEKGYVVTFEQTDPLFTFDLSNPDNPQLLGELEIPGFSTYIHPFGDDHLLTIGRAGGANGVGTGNSYQLQLFDVSDLSNPRRVAAEQPQLADNEFANSIAEYEPHAFTFAASTGLLSIPAQISSNDHNRQFSGFIAYQVSADNGISESARIAHQDSNGGCPNCQSFAPVYGGPLRSVIGSGNTLFTLSGSQLKASSISSSGAVALDTLELDP